PGHQDPPVAGASGGLWFSGNPGNSARQQHQHFLQHRLYRPADRPGGVEVSPDDAMRISNQSRVRSPESKVSRRRTGDCGLRAGDCQSGFTMVEIAISLAIIGIALVSIIGVLPIGLHTQRDNREETLINSDATVFMEAIRGGARGMDDLTNYVFAITNYWTQYKADGTVNGSGIQGYIFTADPTKSSLPPITNGLNIIGLLSTPEYADLNGLPIPNLVNSVNGGYSNHIVAYVRSLSGPAVEKPPQDPSSVIVSDSFGYRILCVNAPVAVDTN